MYNNICIDNYKVIQKILKGLDVMSLKKCNLDPVLIYIMEK